MAGCGMVPPVVWAFTVSASWGPVGDALGLFTDDPVLEACNREAENSLAQLGALRSTCACRALFSVKQHISKPDSLALSVLLHPGLQIFAC